jgi:hypothetical protein
MARRTVFQLIDDIDKTPATQTVTFGLDGRAYTVDLNDEHAAELREFLATYVAVGRRRTPGRKGGMAPRRVDDFDPAAVRAWAASNGVDVSKRGRVPNSVVEQYRSAGY